MLKKRLGHRRNNPVKFMGHILICVCLVLLPLGSTPWMPRAFALSPESMLSGDNRLGTWLGVRLYLLLKAMEKYGLSAEYSAQDLVLETFQGPAPGTDQIPTLEWLAERAQGSKTVYGFKVQRVVIEVSYDTASNQARLETVQGVGREDLERAMADMKRAEKEYVHTELPEQAPRLELERADIPGAMWAGRLLGTERGLIDLQNEPQREGFAAASLELRKGSVWLQRGVYRRLVTYPSWFTLVMALGTAGALSAVFSLHHHDTTVILMVDGPSSIWRGDKYLEAMDDELREALLLWSEELQTLEAQRGIPSLDDTQRKLLYQKIGLARKRILRFIANQQLKRLFLEEVELCKQRDPIYDTYKQVKRELAGLSQPTKDALRELMGREMKLRLEVAAREQKDQIEAQIDEMYRVINANLCVLELDTMPMTAELRDSVIKLMSQIPKDGVVAFYAARQEKEAHAQELVRVLEHFQIKASAVGAQNRDLWNWFLEECYQRGIFLQKRVAGTLLATWLPFSERKILVEIVPPASVQGLAQANPRTGSIQLSQAAFQTGEMAASTLHHGLEDLLLHAPRPQPHRPLRVLRPHFSPEEGSL